jgi:hypothetical protein
MSINVVQEVFGGSTGTASATFTITLPNVVSGNAIHVVAANNNIVSFTGCADGVNSYTSIGVVNDATDSRGVQHWYANNVTGGTLTITVTQGGAGTQMAGMAAEIGTTSGYDASATIPANGGAYQATPGTGTNAITTGNFTPSVQPGLMHAFVYTTGTPYTLLSVGTGFTAGITGDPNAKGGNLGGSYACENKRYTATTAFAGTFTTSISVPVITVAALFKESPPVSIGYMLPSRSTTLYYI